VYSLLSVPADPFDRLYVAGGVAMTRLIAWLFPLYIALMGAGCWLIMEVARNLE
jgi:hypothetical protein